MKKKNEKKEEFDFLKVHVEVVTASETFWNEQYLSVIMKQIEKIHKTKIIRDYSLNDIVMNGDKVLLKWGKRFRPLSVEELAEDWNRDGSPEGLAKEEEED